MRKLTATLALAALPAAGLAAVNASASDDPPVNKAATKTVRVGDNFFKPKTIKVRKGTIVRWVWGTGGATETNVEHNVRGIKGNRFQSKDLTRGVYRKRITKTTSYLCTIHATTMRGKIVVTNP